MSDEDKRTAVGMSVTLSGQLMSAALAVIALGGGLIGVFVQNRDVGWFFYLAVIISFGAFVYSIVLGGNGITISRKNGFEGKWNLQDGASYFNRQAIACLVGLVLFIAAVVLSGKSKDSETSLKIETLWKTSGAFEHRLQALSKANEKVQKDVDALSVKFDKLARRLSESQTKQTVRRPPNKKN